jgi:glycerol kinase
MKTPLLLALDQGTTSTRTIAFGADLAPRATAQMELPQHFPAPGWVEHEPEDIWQGAITTLRQALEKAGGTAADVAGIGITNQRETTLLWDRATGRCLHRAIVWQDRRSADTCAKLRAEGHEAFLTERTGLLADPYFSATKLAWMLDNINVPIGRLTDSCWAVRYQGASAFGETIQGPLFYVPGRDHLNWAEGILAQGGVCGSLSHFGAVAARARTSHTFSSPSPTMTWRMLEIT